MKKIKHFASPKKKKVKSQFSPFRQNTGNFKTINKFKMNLIINCVCVSVSVGLYFFFSIRHFFFFLFPIFSPLHSLPISAQKDHLYNVNWCSCVCVISRRSKRGSNECQMYVCISMSLCIWGRHKYS